MGGDVPGEGILPVMGSGWYQKEKGVLESRCVPSIDTDVSPITSIDLVHRSNRMAQICIANGKEGAS